MDSRQYILDSIREALKKPSHLPEDPPRESLIRAIAAGPQTPDERIARFRHEFAAVAGEYVEAATESAAAERIADILREASADTAAVSGGAVIERMERALAPRGIRIIRPETLPFESRKQTVAQTAVGIVEAAYAAAETATIAVPFAGCSTLPHFLPEIVIALVEHGRLVRDHAELFGKLSAEERRNLMLVTGPSRTADIEKILILGAHGPRRLIVCMLRHAD